MVVIWMLHRHQHSAVVYDVDTTEQNENNIRLNLCEIRESVFCLNTRLVF